MTVFLCRAARNDSCDVDGRVTLVNGIVRAASNAETKTLLAFDQLNHFHLLQQKYGLNFNLTAGNATNLSQCLNGIQWEACNKENNAIFGSLQCLDSFIVCDTIQLLPVDFHQLKADERLRK